MPAMEPSVKNDFSQKDKNYFFILYFILVIIMVLLIFICIPGCRSGGTENATPTAQNQASNIKEPIRIGLNLFPGYAYVFIAADKGFFKNNGVDVELILNEEYSKTLDFYESGGVDGYFGVFSEAILYNAEGFETIVVFVIDYSDTADVILADPLYDSLESLKGKKIGIERINSFSHLFVLQVFKNAGIGEPEMQFEIVPSQEVTEALDTEKIEAGHTWNPEKTKAMEKGYKIVATAGEVPGLITDVLALRGALIKERPSDVLAIVKSLLQARDFLDTNPEEAIKIMIKYEGGTAEEMAAAIKELHLLNLKDNLNAMEPSSETTSLYGAGAIISDYFLNRGQISEVLDFETIIDSSFIKKITENQ